MQYRQQGQKRRPELTRTRRLLAAVRQPEYTGANRCLPCMAVNLVLAGVLTGALSVVSVPAAVAAAGVSLASIWLRGYLVPGTPTLTKRYLPDRVLAWFDKADQPAGFGVAGTDAALDGDVASFDPTGFLLRGDVLLDDETDVRLAPTFEAELAERALAIDDLDTAAARMLDTSPAQIRTTQVGDAWRVLVDEYRVGNWESRAAFVADLAAHEVLSERGLWDEIPTEAGGTVLASIRACLETCPVCAGSITFGTTVVASCCREHEVIAATCGDCDARLFEIRAAQVPE
ncbi:hypothetical protein [Halosegnis longus]|uniref:Uncharacterized protein n=1 Tax=Halosegnis longus TaxID=2216012 RepID=A0AAJ4RA51_9EURY|nr:MULTISPECIES: hypothetical protein [Halobacteriales]RNJ27318.1 hypothetical protein Nmn1133_11930 [Salella cibi]